MNLWCWGIGWLLGKFWLNLKISEEFLVVLEVSLSGDFESRSLKFWNLFLTVLQSLEFVMLYWLMWSFQMRPFSSAALPLVREHYFREQTVAWQPKTTAWKDHLLCSIIGFSKLCKMKLGNFILILQIDR